LGDARNTLTISQFCESLLVSAHHPALASFDLGRGATMIGCGLDFELFFCHVARYAHVLATVMSLYLQPTTGNATLQVD
jgi:hypothetical protein